MSLRLGKRAHLYTWARKWQLDVWFRGYYYCIGWSRRAGENLIAYRSPNATPWHHDARGWGADTATDRCACGQDDCTAPMRNMTP